MKTSGMAFAEVVLPLPLKTPFTYEIPEALIESVGIGRRVEVPFGNRYLVGVVTALSDKAPGQDVKPLSAVLDRVPSSPRKLLELLSWMAEYYHAPLGEAFKIAFAPGLLSAERWTISLAPAGRALLDGLPTGIARAGSENRRKKLIAALGMLPGTGELTTDAFMKKAGRISRKVLRAWEREGFITLRSTPPGAAASSRSIEIIEAAAAREDGLKRLSRAPIQAAAFGTLFDIGPIGRTEFAAGDKSRARAVSELIRRGLVKVTRKTVRRSPLGRHLICDEQNEAPPEKLWPGQAQAVEAVAEAINREGGDTFLLFGPPGSGKTEVYLRAAENVLSMGKTALFLVPEISLTPQFVSRICARFGDRAAVWHSGLSAGERFDEWRRVRNGEAPLVVGARSAVFAPLEKLGLIVVDEEQDGSYKSEDHVYYQARDVAVMRGKIEGATVLLGSATPSVESVANARSGRYRELRLDRPEAWKQPKITVVDLSRPRPSRRSLLTSELVLAIKERLGKKEQSILFLNRRGFAPFLVCCACKKTVDCRECSVTMTYHRTNGMLICHSCGIMRRFPQSCPNCGKEELELVGVGTQRLEDELELTFPEARIARLDRDAISRRGALQRILNGFAAGETDILVGTQLVAKGHDFPNVTLVGVLSADQSLHIPDFRAAERSYQLLAQVAGRAGRREREGEVIIQTFQPRHFVFPCVAGHDPEKFYDRELDERRKVRYPPFRRLAMIRVEGKDNDRVFEHTTSIIMHLRELSATGKGFGEISVIGPAPAPILIVRKNFRYRVQLKSASRTRLQSFLKAASKSGLFDQHKGLKIIVDVDPNSFG